MEKIKEQVEVVAIFSKGQIKPRIFRWAGRLYRVDKIDLIHDERVGRHKKYYFSFCSGANCFVLSFHSGTLSWMLEEIDEVA